MNAVRRFVADETAATAIEYCLIASGIAHGIFVAVAGMEATINAKFMAINSSLRYPPPQHEQSKEFDGS